MKASKLRNTPRGTVVGLPWDGGIINGHLGSVAHYEDTVRALLDVSGQGEITVFMHADDSVEIYGVMRVITSPEAIQFKNDPDTVEEIRKFVGVAPEDIRTSEGIVIRNFNTKEPDRLYLFGGPWIGTVEEGYWLVKRNGRVVVMSNETFEVLFS